MFVRKQAEENKTFFMFVLLWGRELGSLSYGEQKLKEDLKGIFVKSKIGDVGFTPVCQGLGRSLGPFLWRQ